MHFLLKSTCNWNIFCLCSLLLPCIPALNSCLNGCLLSQCLYFIGALSLSGSSQKGPTHNLWKNKHTALYCTAVPSNKNVSATTFSCYLKDDLSLQLLSAFPPAELPPLVQLSCVTLAKSHVLCPTIHLPWTSSPCASCMWCCYCPSAVSFARWITSSACHIQHWRENEDVYRIICCPAYASSKCSSPSCPMWPTEVRSLPGNPSLCDLVHACDTRSELRWQQCVVVTEIQTAGSRTCFFVEDSVHAETKHCFPVFFAPQGT